MLAIQSISVIVPCHNCKQEILYTIQSIERSIELFRQIPGEHQNIPIEVIVVDDKSTDNTPLMLEIH